MKMKKYQLLCACIAFIGAIALGFPVIVTGRRVRIPRVPLLQMLGYAVEGGVAV